jgi:hypothetical protein
VIGAILDGAGRLLAGLVTAAKPTPAGRAAREVRRLRKAHARAVDRGEHAKANALREQLDSAEHYLASVTP